jgi:hypothetical protein
MWGRMKIRPLSVFRRLFYSLLKQSSDASKGITDRTEELSNRTKAASDRPEDSTDSAKDPQT